MGEEDIVIYQHGLPHWRLGGSVFFVTWRLAPPQYELTPKERFLIVSSLCHFDGNRYELFAFVVMPDHVHVLVKPLENYSLQGNVHSWKSFASHKLVKEYGRGAPVWQDEYFDRIIRGEQEFLEKAQYILNNPLKFWTEGKDYPWVWFKQD